MKIYRQALAAASLLLTVILLAPLAYWTGQRVVVWLVLDVPWDASRDIVFRRFLSGNTLSIDGSLSLTHDGSISKD